MRNGNDGHAGDEHNGKATVAKLDSEWPRRREEERYHCWGYGGKIVARKERVEVEVEVTAEKCALLTTAETTFESVREEFAGKGG